MKKRPIILVGLCIAVIFGSCFSSKSQLVDRDSCTNNRVNIEIRHYGLGPGSWHMYSSMDTSPNGDIYAGICNYSFAMKMSDTLNGAWLVRYAPDEDKMYPLGDMQDVTGQRGRDKAPAQSKIHTPILFDRDGKVYFGTHSVERDYLPEEYKERFTDEYPGGHWISYEPATGKFEDLGISAPGESIMGLTMDPKRRKLYGTTHKKALLVEYDIARRVSKTIGSIGEYPTRMITCLADGKAYTCDEKGYLLRYDPASESIEKLDLRIPFGEYEAELISLFALCASPSRDRFYGISTLIDEASVRNVIKGGFLFEYKIDNNGNGTLTDLGSAGVSGETVVSETGLYHAMTLGKDGKFYWTAPKKEGTVCLMSYNPKT
ncbi:MAG: hypothetical protein ABIH23_27000, partial [bacterium]